MVLRSTTHVSLYIMTALSMAVLLLGAQGQDPEGSGRKEHTFDLLNVAVD